MKALILIAGILASQMAFAENECAIAVVDIHQDSVDTMVLKGYVAIDKSQEIQNKKPSTNDALAFMTAIMDEGEYTAVNSGDDFLLMQKKSGRITIVNKVRASNIDEAAKLFPACKDL